MIVFAYTLFDRKALNYNPPFYAANHMTATRIVSDAAQDLKTNLGRHPNDFVLYCCGSYDDATGALVPSSPLVHVVDVQSLVSHQAPELLPKAAS